MAIQCQQESYSVIFDVLPAEARHSQNDLVLGTQVLGEFLVIEQPSSAKPLRRR